MQLISKELTDFLYSARQKLDIHTYTETSPWINFANSETLQIIKVLKKKHGKCSVILSLHHMSFLWSAQR